MGMTNPIPSKCGVSSHIFLVYTDRRRQLTEAKDRRTARSESVKHTVAGCGRWMTYPIISGKSFPLNKATLATPRSAMSENSLEKI